MSKDLDLQKEEGAFPLKNGDQIIVRPISGYEDIRMVRIEGEVMHPGAYNIINKAERISDLVTRAGGFTSYAYPLGAYLIRYEKSGGVEQILKQKMVINAKRQIVAKSEKNSKLDNLKDANVQDQDSENAKDGAKTVEQILDPEGIVGINLQEIIKNPDIKQNLYLEEGDVIYVPRELQTVRVLGEVLFPTDVAYEKGMSLKDYVSNAGGFSNKAQRKRAFVLYANGNARSTRSFLWMKFYPPIDPGAHVVIPEKPLVERNKLTTAEAATLLGSMTTITTLLISVLSK